MKRKRDEEEELRKTKKIQQRAVEKEGQDSAVNSESDRKIIKSLLDYIEFGDLAVKICVGLRNKWRKKTSLAILTDP